MTMKDNVMKPRYRLFRRAGVFYYEDTATGQQLSLDSSFSPWQCVARVTCLENFRPVAAVVFPSWRDG